MAPPFAHVLVTGASSGLGRALALACAAPGVTLHLGGRDGARLDAVAAAARQAGAHAAARVVDVRDRAGMAAWIGAAGRLDLVIANAGISGGSGRFAEAGEEARAIFDTNVGGVLNTAFPAIAQMAGQPPGADGLRGRVAVIASLAALVSAPGAPAYCASKAAVQRWAEALDATERQRGVRLHAVCPGYVATPMTAGNVRSMPFLLTPEQAAALTLRGIAAGRLRIAYPWPLYLGALFAAALPPGWRNRLLRRGAVMAELP